VENFVPREGLIIIFFVVFVVYRRRFESEALYSHNNGTIGNKKDRVTNQSFSQQDETMTVCSTLELTVCMQGYLSKLPSLKLESRPKQLIGSLSFNVALHE
jgi:hypothetical protein